MNEPMSAEKMLYYQMIRNSCFIDIKEEIKHPPIALSCGFTISGKNSLKKYPIPIGTMGNFSFVQAPPKSYKTYFISLLASSYASDECIYSGDIKSHRTNEQILWFDTEQSKFHAKLVTERVQRMNPSLKLDFYHPFALREMSYANRIDFIDFELEQQSKNGKQIGLVIIDGISDLVSDVNNLSECNDAIQKLMTWTTKYNCHIVTVIHSNFGSDKPTGHLGSLCEKKAETQMELKFDSTAGKMQVSCKRSRNTPFEDFYFFLDENKLPIFSY